MSNKYQRPEDVPTEVLVRRLLVLAEACTKNGFARDRELTMRVPAELDRDADVVISEAAKRLSKLAGLDLHQHDGIPCSPMCTFHVTHPCHKCGRQWPQAKAQKMTNTGHIPIRVGQVWLIGGTDSMGNCGYDGEYVVKSEREIHEHCGRRAWYTSILEDGSLDLTLKWCPIFGDMSNWRIVTDDEKREHEVPECAEAWAKGCFWYDAGDGEKWSMFEIWRVPRDFKWPAKETLADLIAADLRPLLAKRMRKESTSGPETRENTD